ncbi:MAG: indole-3-glycerol phosphate synthase TrpC [Clostridiales Family XIII bacterium]|jgi:indole-3-glycerol phosphate synthase|nr:indole-3-glycerol phosphate synthase TrpC [Clostridiales Family XIII bacterium]
MNILEELAGAARVRVKEAKQRVSAATVQSQASSLAADTGFPFEAALGGAGLSFICEVKKASPSKGLIAPDFPYVEIAREYEAAGADAVSVLTEPTRFLGEDAFLAEISAAVSLPTLRKDFVVDSYQIYEAKLLGASAVLLICALLGEAELASFIRIADGLGLSCLVEAHSAEETRAALAAGARVVGVNHRDLTTFSMDLGLSERLRPLVPPGVLFVAESGISGPGDTRRMKAIGADAVLVGESFMRAADKAALLRELKDV